MWSVPALCDVLCERPRGPGGSLEVPRKLTLRVDNTAALQLIEGRTPALVLVLVLLLLLV